MGSKHIHPALPHPLFGGPQFQQQQPMQQPLSLLATSGRSDKQGPNNRNLHDEQKLYNMHNMAITNLHPAFIYCQDDVQLVKDEARLVVKDDVRVMKDDVQVMKASMQRLLQNAVTIQDVHSLFHHFHHNMASIMRTNIHAASYWGNANNQTTRDDTKLLLAGSTDCVPPTGVAQQQQAPTVPQQAPSNAQAPSANARKPRPPLSRPSTTAFPKPKEVYHSATEMYQDWYGHANSRFGVVGMAKLEEDMGTFWRRSFSPGEQKRFSRLKYIMQQIELKQQALLMDGSMDAQADALLHFNEIMQQHKTCRSLSGLERFLKATAKKAD